MEVHNFAHGKSMNLVITLSLFNYWFIAFIKLKHNGTRPTFFWDLSLHTIILKNIAV